MTDLSELKAQYTSMTYDELINVKNNAVLTGDAKQIFDEVLASKESEHFYDNIETQTRLKEAKGNKDYSELKPEEIDFLSSQIIMTTESAPMGLEIEKRLEIITAECVYGMNIFRDVFIAVRDIFGGRSGGAQKLLRDARKVCLAELKREALMLGADAVIGVRLDYSEISGNKSQMLMIVASGTAVNLLNNKP